MRAEVVLLSRNITIRANNANDDWGCRIIVSDFLDTESGFELREGNMTLDYVEVKWCSQKDTYNAAINFDGTVGAPKVITNSAFHSGEGIGVYMKGSEDINLNSNVFVNFTKYGIWAVGSRRVILDSNQVHLVKRWG